MVLKLKNSGPGVLDSNMTFDAHLLHNNGTIVDETLYIYEWKDDAFTWDKEETVNHTKSQLQKVYYSDDITFVKIYKPGTYQMNVTVYKKANPDDTDRGPKVADGTMEFVLTGTILHNDWYNKLNSVKNSTCLEMQRFYIWINAKSR